jgi:hypothetical protein
MVASSALRPSTCRTILHGATKGRVSEAAPQRWPSRRGSGKGPPCRHALLGGVREDRSLSALRCHTRREGECPVSRISATAGRATVSPFSALLGHGFNCAAPRTTVGEGLSAPIAAACSNGGFGAWRSTMRRAAEGRCAKLSRAAGHRQSGRFLRIAAASEAMANGSYLGVLRKRCRSVTGVSLPVLLDKPLGYSLAMASGWYVCRSTAAAPRLCSQPWGSSSGAARRYRTSGLRWRFPQMCP